MEFKTNHCDLYPPEKRKSTLSSGLKIPTDRDFYFRAKQYEIVDQYTAARFFLAQTEGENYKAWLIPNANPRVTEGIEYTWKGYFYESALMYYNILVDLSWTLCYLSAEFVCYEDEVPVEFDSIKSLSVAAELMRKAESLLDEPTSSTNPLKYIEKVRPEFSNAIQMIIEFWKQYKESSIRVKYNYLKHRGKPAYKEISNLKGPKLAKYFVQQPDAKGTHVAFDTRDIRYEMSLKDSIIELQRFDDEILFPYLKQLISELEQLVNPSPLAF